MRDFKSKVLVKIQEMEKYLTELEEMVPPTIQEYQQNLTLRRACEKTAELAIKMVLDIISIIVSSKKLGIPQSEDNLIEILGNKKILSPSLSRKVLAMKGFGNILVHKYGNLEDDRAYLFFTQELGDFTLFEKEIKKYLKTQP